MKKILILGTLLVIFVLYNCKKKETQPKEMEAPEKTYTEVLHDKDTTVQVSPIDKEVEKNESKAVSQTTTKTEVNKTVPTTVKVENTTITVTEPISEKKTEVAINTPVEPKTEPITEPIATKEPEKTNSNTWKVPSNYVTMKNPIPANQDASIGKSLFDNHCKSCHGKEGYGDGPKAADLKGDLGDFSSLIFQKQTDGELFYKTTFGRDDMPEFSKKMPDEEDRWLIINYIRTLAE